MDRHDSHIPNRPTPHTRTKPRVPHECVGLLADALSPLETEKEAMKLEATKAETRLREADERIKHSDASTAGLASEVAAAKTALAEKEALLHEAEEQVSFSQREFKNLKVELRDQGRENAGALKANDKLVAQLQSAAAESRGWAEEREALEAQIMELESSVSGLKASLADAKTGLQEKEAALHDSEGALETMQLEVAELRAKGEAHENLLGKLQEAKTEREQLAIDKVELESQLREAQGILEIASPRHQSVVAELAEAKSKAAKKEQEALQWERDRQQHAKETQALENAIAAVQATLLAKEQEVAEGIVVVDGLRMEISASNIKLKGKEQAAKKAIEERDAMIEELEQLRANNMDLAPYLYELAEAKSKIEKLESAIEAAGINAEEQAVEIAQLKQKVVEKIAIIADMGPRQEAMARANADLTAQLEALEKELGASIEKAAEAARSRPGGGA